MSKFPGCGKSELCIFDRPSPQVVVESASFEEVFPINSINNNSDIEFNINGSSTGYLDLNDTLLYVKVKATKADGKDLVDEDVRLSTYAFHNLFKDIELKLNNVVVEGGNNMYAHKAVIESTINCSTDTIVTTLMSVGYMEDAKLKSAIEKSKEFEMCGSLQLDFFDQPKYLIPGVNVYLRLKKSNDSFCLVTPTAKFEPKLQILEAKLYVRRVKVEQSVYIGHKVGLKRENAYYPMQKTSIIRHPLSTGTTSFYKDLIFGDLRLPKFILVTFLSSDYSYKTDPAIFSHCNVSSIQLTKDSDYRETYTQDFENNLYTLSYVQSVIRNLGYLNKNENIGITRNDFKDNAPFFTFVLAPDFDTNQTQLPAQGNIRLDIKFQKGLTEPAALLIYGVFDGEIQISDGGAIFI